jgi:hypothetical protein
MLIRIIADYGQVSLATAIEQGNLFSARRLRLGKWLKPRDLLDGTILSLAAP